MAKRSRNSKGRFTGSGYIDRVRDRPAASAAVVAVASGLAAAGAFLWLRRDRIGETLSSGRDWLAEIKAKLIENHPSQTEIAEEALTLKEIGKKTRVPATAE